MAARFLSVLIVLALMVGGVAAQDDTGPDVMTTPVQTGPLPAGDLDFQAARWTADGTGIAIPGSGGLWLYNSEALAEGATLFANIASVDSVAFSPSGQLVAIGQSNIVELWDFTTGEVLSTLVDNGGDDSFVVLGFSQDSTRLITSRSRSANDVEGVLTVWDIATLTAPTPIVQAITPGLVNAATLNFEQDMLFAGFDVLVEPSAEVQQRGVYLYDLLNDDAFPPPAPIVREPGQPNAPTTTSNFDTITTDFYVSPDTDHYAVTEIVDRSSSDTAILRLYDTFTGRVARELSWNTVGSSGTFTDIDISADGQNVAFAERDGLIRLHNLEFEVETTRYEIATGATLEAVEISPDGTRIAGFYADGVRIWEIERWGSLYVGSPVRVFTTEGEILNIRSGPGLSFNIIVEAPLNTLAILRSGATEADGFNWYEIELPDGRLGFAAGQVGDLRTLIPLPDAFSVVVIQG